MIEHENMGPLTYKTNSLFDPGGPENQCLGADPLITNRKEHTEVYSETYALQKFGAFYFDYLYTAEEKNFDDKAPQGSHIVIKHHM